MSHKKINFNYKKSFNFDGTTFYIVHVGYTTGGRKLYRLADGDGNIDKYSKKRKQRPIMREYLLKTKIINDKLLNSNGSEYRTWQYFEYILRIK